MATTRDVPDRDLLRQLDGDGLRYEIVDGEVRVSPAGMRHGQILVRLTLRLGGFVMERGLGQVFDSSTGFRPPSGNLRSPDLSFIAAGRLPAGAAPEGYGEMAPDLVVEVLSTSENPRHVLDKVGEYLGWGVRLVWIIDPQKRRAVVYRSLTEVREIPEDGALEGEGILPGFSCPLSSLLA